MPGLFRYVEFMNRLRSGRFPEPRPINHLPNVKRRISHRTKKKMAMLDSFQQAADNQADQDRLTVSEDGTLWKGKIADQEAGEKDSETR